MPSIKTYFWLLPIFLPGCVQNEKIDRETLVIGIESIVKNMDRRSTTEANATLVGDLFAQTLVRAGPGLLPVGDLAQSFEVHNGLRYVFHLSPEVRFHDGHPLTCADVEFNFRQAAENASNLQNAFANIERRECRDPHTFVVVLKKPRASFLLTEIGELRIYPKHYADHPDFPYHPIGSGPYRFVRQTGRDLLFERYEGYRRFRNAKPLPLPFFKRVIIRTIQDPTTRFLSLMGGDLDMLVNALSPRMVQEATQNPYLRVLRAPGTTYQYIGLNLRLPKFQDLRVREALSLALDRESIVQHKLLGRAQVANFVLSPANYFHNAAIPFPRYDPIRARALLKAAGAENLTLEFKTSTDRDISSVALILKEQWERVGVKVQIRPYEFATFFADIRQGNFEIFSLRWTSVIDPGLLNQIFHSQELPPGRNRVAYKNPTVDALLERAQTEPRLVQRKRIYDEAQARIAHDMPYISLWYPDNIAVVSHVLKNFKLEATGSWLSFLDAWKD